MSDQNRRNENLKHEENPRIDKARILKDRLEKKYAERSRDTRETSRSGNRAESQLSTPAERKNKLFAYNPNPDAFGRMTEAFARYMGTPQFLLWMTVFCGVWLGWNTLAPEELQFDPRSLNFTLLTLMLSLQASYAAPLLLLAQNRQDDRDRVVASEDRKRDQQNLEETQYLTREIASLRIALREVATRDFVRSELRDILEELSLFKRSRNAKPNSCRILATISKNLKMRTGKKTPRLTPKLRSTPPLLKTLPTPRHQQRINANDPHPKACSATQLSS